MRHHNSLFHQLLQFVPWGRFEQLVERHGADRRVRRMTTKSQLIALMYGQLAGAQSLREIEQGMSSHAHRLYHLGAAKPAVPRSPMPTPSDPRSCFLTCSP